MKDSVLDVDVSHFDRYNARYPNKVVSLLDWLLSNEHRDKVQQVRACDDKDTIRTIKSSLPAVTPSGLFGQSRTIPDLIEYTGMLCMDIDGKDNPGINSMEEIKELLSHVEEVAYCGLSVSGKGVFAIFPVEDPEQHTGYFLLLEKFLKTELGITVDASGKDLSRLRGASYDPKPYVNHYANPLKNGLRLPEKTIHRPVMSFVPEKPSEGDVKIYFQILNAVTQARVDITDGEPNWFDIGCVTANMFGEAGRKYFHQFSQFHERYNSRECDRKYNGCLKGYRRGIVHLIEIFSRYV